MREVNLAIVHIVIDPEVLKLYDNEEGINGFFKPSTENAAAVDIRASCWGEVGPNCTIAVPTGIFMQITDKNMAALLLPRSGGALKRKITLGNSPGLIDPDYRGEMKLILHNEDPENVFKWEVGERLAQVMFVPFFNPLVKLVDALEETARGTGGFGSTGTR